MCSKKAIVKFLEALHETFTFLNIRQLKFDIRSSALYHIKADKIYDIFYSNVAPRCINKMFTCQTLVRKDFFRFEGMQPEAIFSIWKNSIPKFPFIFEYKVTSCHSYNETSFSRKFVSAY